MEIENVYGMHAEFINKHFYVSTNDGVQAYKHLHALAIFMVCYISLFCDLIHYSGVAGTLSLWWGQPIKMCLIICAAVSFWVVCMCRLPAQRRQQEGKPAKRIDARVL